MTNYIFTAGSWECEVWNDDIYLIDYRYDFCIVIPKKAKDIRLQTISDIKHGGTFEGIFEKNLRAFLKKHMTGKKVTI
jgi:hypothetical protein